MHSVGKAFKKCISWIGLSIEIPLWSISIVSWLLVSRPTWKEIWRGEYIVGLYIFTGFFLLIFIIFLVWEFQLQFPRIEVSKFNGFRDIAIIINNKEVVDFEDVVIELKSLKQIFPGSMNIKYEWPVMADNNTIKIEGQPHVGYDSPKQVRIADLQEDKLTICLDSPLDWTSWVNPGGGTKDNAILEVELHIKGTIEGRPIYPKIVKGRLVYWRQPQVFEIEDAGRKRKIDTIASGLVWEIPNEKK